MKTELGSNEEAEAAAALARRVYRISNGKFFRRKGRRYKQRGIWFRLIGFGSCRMALESLTTGVVYKAPFSGSTRQFLNEVGLFEHINDLPSCPDWFPYPSVGVMAMKKYVSVDDVKADDGLGLKWWGSDCYKKYIQPHIRDIHGGNLAWDAEQQMLIIIDGGI